MSEYINISVEFKTHIKWHRLQRLAGEDGIIALIYLWIVSAEFMPDGMLLGYTAEDIAIAADWEGDADMFVDALLSAGFLAFDGQTYSLLEVGEDELVWW